MADHNQTPSRLWVREGLKSGWDVTWTTAGRVAVSDSETNTVTLWNISGEEICNSKSQGVELSSPSGISYHRTWHGGCIVVVEVGKCTVRALHPDTLQLLDSVNLQDQCRYLSGITTMYTGDIVVCGGIRMSSFHHRAIEGVVVLTMSGSSSSYQKAGARVIVTGPESVWSVKHKWRLPTDKSPRYIISTSDDHLLISVRGAHTVYKTTVRGTIVWQTDLSITPYPCGISQHKNTSSILLCCSDGSSGDHIRVVTSASNLLQRHLLPPPGFTWGNSLKSVSCHDNHLAVLHMSKLELWSQ